MQIVIPLPQFTGEITGYKEIKSYLKQVELAVHHCQKSVESAENMGVTVGEDTIVQFYHPFLEDQTSEELKNFGENYYSELQDVQIKITLQ